MHLRCAMLLAMVVVGAVAIVALDEDSEELDSVPKDVELESNGTQMPANDSEKVDNAVDLEWVGTAVRDVAYFLRAHKFNEYDRRFYLKESDATKDLFAKFPEPPLRSLHWEVRSNCETGFIDCLKYLQERALTTDLHRMDDTVTIMHDQKWTLAKNLNEVKSSNATCTNLFLMDKRGAQPFLGPLERFQWRTTASYYMCWYTMQSLPHLILFGEPCDNFASCLHPVFGANHKDPRADDSLKYQCALYSFCPDPCCPQKHYKSLNECWNAKSNPCFNEAPSDKRECHFNRHQNTDFLAMILNQWNVSCNCTNTGFQWSSRFGMCVDIDECVEGSHSCNQSNESCFNLPGSYKCGCKWGYLFDISKQQCMQSSILMSVETYKQNKGSNGQKKTSIIKLIQTKFYLVIDAVKKLKKYITNSARSEFPTLAICTVIVILTVHIVTQ